jgi:CheY-like chemotaxis protein
VTDSRHILLVEDDFAIREAVTEVLTDAGFLVTCAANGQEALSWLGAVSWQPGVILLDLMMPVMDGWEFRTAQRGDPRYSDIPVVVLSADAESTTSLARLDPSAYLPKPFELDRLLDVVGQYCARH